MRFRSLRLQHVRQFGADGLSLADWQPGLNVLARPNEFGKSTILDAIKAVLFLPASTNKKSVRSLIPHNTDEHPLIALEFEQKGQRFRIRKCFARSKKSSSTTLENASTGERWVEADAEKRLAELMGTPSAEKGSPSLLWVGQGANLKPEKLTPDQGAVLSSLLSDELTDVVGGEQAQHVRRLAEDALAALSYKNGGPRGALKALLNERDECDATIAEAETALKLTDTLRSEVISLRRRQRDLNNPDEQQRLIRDVEEAEKEVAEARRNQDLHGHTQDLLTRGEAALVQAQNDLQRHENSVNHLKKIKKDLSMAERTLAELRVAHGRAKSQQDRNRAVADQKLKVAEKANADLQRARLHERHAQAARDRQRLVAQLEKAHVLASQITAARKTATRAPIDLEALAQADEERLKAESARDAAAPYVTLDHHAGLPVRLDGVPVEEGEPLPVIGAGILQVGEARLRIGRRGGDGRAEKVRNAQTRLAQAFAKAGVSSLAEARRVEDERRLAVKEMGYLNQALLDAAPDGIDALKAQIDDLEASPPPEPEAPMTATDAEARYQSAAQSAAQAQADLERSLKAVTDAERALASAETEARLLQNQWDQATGQAGDDEQQAEQRCLLKQKVETCRDEVGAHRRALEGLKQNAKALQAAEQKLQRLKASLEQNRIDRGRVERDLAGKEASLDAALGPGPAEALAEAKDQRRDLDRRVQKLEARQRALRLLIETLEAEQAQRRQRVQAPVMAHIEPMIERVYGAGQLHFDAEWNPLALKRPGGELGVEALSGGTQEQIALITRLGFAKLAASEGQPVPLILDDALVYADDDRVERLFDLLTDVAQGTQVLILTCRERLFARLGGHRLTPEALAASL